MIKYCLMKYILFRIEKITCLKGDKDMFDAHKICDDVARWIKENVNDAKAEGVIFGLSGGIDSAVVAGLSKKAFPKNSIGVIMPCHSIKEDEEHALLVAERLDLKTIKVDLTDVFDKFILAVWDDGENQLARANVKPRLRMTTLYYLAQKNNYLVVGPSNKSEFTVGYFTKHGDSGVDLLPIASFVKEEVKEMAKFLNIPDTIINKPPSAGLWQNQTDEKEMGFSYEILDKYIRTGEGEEKIVNKIKKMNKSSQHKREFPPIYTFDRVK